ncbi:DNA repair and recombination protein RAD54B isoform X1 [Pangasianodon hypophthalmus]|uniref:DNA repair and recombination protein RAD54B isoform X1 n=1 Tax=Pangasianodon hypophthalmus TaxID=310915 RepID=UPI002307A018|nr:DNA repair and recombination protein RAD54B isoform X1 [Pangasianodon hypophthalmus]
MRRSAAPSQLLHGNAAKKPRFVPPAPVHTGAVLISNPGPVPTSNAVPSSSPGLVPTSAPKPAPRNVLNKVQKSLSGRTLHTPAFAKVPAEGKALARVLSAVAQEERKENGPESPSFSLESGQLPDSPSPQQPDLPSTHTTTKPTARYYSVMWCKASSRKHKRWEGDAVLVATGRSVVLKDMEGRDIGRGSGYKASELESLCEGQTLMVGGKQIEVMGVVSDEDYAKGRCFQDAIVELPLETTAKAPVRQQRPQLAKPFARPTLKDATMRASEPEGPVCKPRHDPNSPGALVMPRPPANHQWLCNKNGLPLVDVVVDPHLTNHLRPHQREGVVFLYECLVGMRLAGRCGAILADEMGLGKTLQCVCVLWTLLRQGPYGGRPVLKRALVVCPGSLVKNWAVEFNKWLGRERISVYTVDQDNRVEDFVSCPRSPVMVISYEMLLRSVDALKKLEFGLVICDEGHRLKNSNIKTAGALTALACERRVILTGTPVQNDLQEFYSIIEFVNPGILGTSAAYRKIYEEPILKSRQPTCTEEERCIGEERAAELARLTGAFTLRRTQEIINRFLPGRLEWTVFCRPTELQVQLYSELLSSRLVRACFTAAGTHTFTHSPHLACINALKKLCNHPGLLYNTIKEKTTDDLYDSLGVDIFPENYATGSFCTGDSGKLLVLADLLAAIKHVNCKDKVVLVSNYTQTLDLLQDLCAHLGYTWCRLDGQTPVAQRQRIVDSFNRPDSSHFLFLLSSKAGGVGLNLVGASHLVLYDIDWNPANDIQAMARVWRDGQKKTVHIYRFLTTGTIEEKIYQRQVSKQGLSGAVVDLGKKGEHINFSAEELRDLFTFDPNTDCLTHDLLGCKCSGDGRMPGVVEDVTVVTGRACQLGRRADGAGVPQRVSMSELMQWKHFSGTIPSYGDVYLDHAHSHITYAFQSTTSKTQDTA